MIKSMDKNFEKYDLTEQEEKQGYEVSEVTLAVLHNLRTGYANDLLADCLRYKCGSEEEKVDIAYKKGAMEALDYVIEGIKQRKEELQFNATQAPTIPEDAEL